MSNNNPYESPSTANTSQQPVKSSNLREMLGLTKEDLWAYVGLALLVVGCFVPKVWMVAAAFVVSTLCLVAYLVTSAPKYSGRSNLHPGVKVYGMVNNALLVVIHVAVIAARIAYLAYFQSFDALVK